MGRMEWAAHCWRGVCGRYLHVFAAKSGIATPVRTEFDLEREWSAAEPG
jgi:hypothetical protein